MLQCVLNFQVLVGLMKHKKAHYLVFEGDMKENGESIPVAMATKKYSGKFMVRVPPETHRHLAIEAAEAGVSLNRLVASRLH